MLPDVVYRYTCSSGSSGGGWDVTSIGENVVIYTSSVLTIDWANGEQEQPTL